MGAAGNIPGERQVGETRHGRVSQLRGRQRPVPAQIAPGQIRERYLGRENSSAHSSGRRPAAPSVPNHPRTRCAGSAGRTRCNRLAGFADRRNNLLGPLQDHNCAAGMRYV